MKKAKYLLLSTLIFSSLSVTQIVSTTNTKEVKFNNCSEARAAGYVNIKRGETGYNPKLDIDNDGTACELVRNNKKPLNKINVVQPKVETTPETTTENNTKPDLIGSGETSTLENNPQPKETEPKTEETKPTEESSANNLNNTETSENNGKTDEPSKIEEVKEDSNNKTQTGKDTPKIEESNNKHNDTKKPNISDKTTTPELNINHDNKENSSSTKTQILGVELTSKPTENTTIKEENDHNQKTTATLKPTPKKITPKKETHEPHTKKALPKTSAVK